MSPVRLQLVSKMTRFSQLTLRNFLIATHDALATAFAFLAAFYLRFEGGNAFFARLPRLLEILPWFVLFSVGVCYFFNLTTTKWRFISLPDALNILRVASVLTVALVILDYIFIFVSGIQTQPVFFGRITIVLYWFLEVFSLSALRFGYRYCVLQFGEPGSGVVRCMVLASQLTTRLFAFDELLDV